MTVNTLTYPSIQDLTSSELNDKVVLVRVDFNVPMKHGQVVDATRIRESLPTIDFLLSAGSKIVLITHLGRPKGQVDSTYSLKAVYEYVKTNFLYNINFVSDTVGDTVHQAVSELQSGQILLLENVRFHNEETQNDTRFSQQLAQLADLFVQDAFGAVHRAHASTAGVAKLLPSYMGLLVKKEVDFLSRALRHPDRPYVAIIGGAKVSSKIEVIKQLLQQVDSLVIGGAMAFTFLKAQGYDVGKSLYEDDYIDLAKELIDQAKSLGKRLILPEDVVVTDSIQAPTCIKTVLIDSIESSLMGVDVGEQSLQTLKHVLADAKMIVWNGPLGVFEVDEFSTGTCQCARYLSSSNATTIVGGGDSIAALEKVQLSATMTHISTGGGACLEFLEGKVLPGIAVIGSQNEN